MAQVVHKQSDLKNDEVTIEGKVILEHLEIINMDAWYYIYPYYIQSQGKK